MKLLCKYLYPFLHSEIPNYSALFQLTATDSFVFFKNNIKYYFLKLLNIIAFIPEFRDCLLFDKSLNR